MTNRIIKSKQLMFGLLLLLSGLLVVDIAMNGGIFSAHDIIPNLVYFGAFYNSLIEGNIIPRWAADIANLYGSPTIMFFYPLSYYLTSVIRIVGFSLIDSLKIYLVISFLVSPFVMYYWLRKHVSYMAAFIGAVLYVWAPYRINDIYARGSVAENTAFMFIPLISLALYLLWEKPILKRIIFLAFTLSALILSHPFMLLIYLPFYVFYIFFLGWQNKKIGYLLIASILSLLLTAFYWLPLIVENKYTHYDISSFNGVIYSTQFVTWEKLIRPDWTFIDRLGKLEYQTYQIGLIQIVLLIGSLLFLIIRSKTVDRRLMRLALLSFVSLVLSVFLMVSVSDIVYRYISVLQRIEFPWRYMALTIYSLAVIVSVITASLSAATAKIFFIILIIVSSIFLYFPYAKGHDYKKVSDNHYLYNITENYDSFATLPRWAAQPDKYPKIKDRYSVISDDASITVLKRTSTLHRYQSDSNEEFRFIDATFYFPGWNVFIDGKKQDIEFQDPSFRGLITFYVPAGQHLIEVVFQNTKLRNIADITSFLTLSGIMLTFISRNKPLRTISFKNYRELKKH